MKNIFANFVIFVSLIFACGASAADISSKIGEIHFSKHYNRIENKNKIQPFLNKIFSRLAEKRKYSYITKYDKLDSSGRSSRDAGL